MNGVEIAVLLFAGYWLGRTLEYILIQRTTRTQRIKADVQRIQIQSEYQLHNFWMQLCTQYAAIAENEIEALRSHDIKTANTLNEQRREMIDQHIAQHQKILASLNEELERVR